MIEIFSLQSAVIPRSPQRILGHGVVCIRRAGCDADAVVRGNPVLAKVPAPRTTLAQRLSGPLSASRQGCPELRRFVAPL